MMWIYQLQYKDYTFKEGEPYSLSQLYKVNATNVGFPPYYIFMQLGVEYAYPFVFNREGIPGKDKPYSRCNVVLNCNAQYLIPDRKYNSGYAEDTEPCLGMENLRIIKGSKDIKWFATDALYNLKVILRRKQKRFTFIQMVIFASLKRQV